ncbi:TPA: hypothetical protein PVK60_000527 [Acinetobacter baumannii]|jgi:hypothetical protein|uniref:DUF1508 domain-containing protein n=1 Tax=Acinetobacter nosocomialis NIPH 386 TaxID=1217985 RepID=A0AAV3IM15_ACINO|nr:MULTISPECIES: hypothetical protein [Acinetobacter calcoaceticus/baumannii complex]EHU1527879.1 hypothetical protein [Acinetobacter baumannii]EHU1539735.1 hypothetical protein [Acinetobacter baumannii]EHU2002690.1 hypothetical protein [Acinetobacter baumannii]ENV40611.1 hypothetical protein F958_03645 [Acinetobacter nosocomialis NIPH 386]KQE81139.1 hypothetical protein APB92_05240 [Acinetobacter pittii]
MIYSHDHLYILYSSIESFACNPEGNYKLVVYTKGGQRHEFNYQSREEQKRALELMKENVGK